MKTQSRAGCAVLVAVALALLAGGCGSGGGSSSTAPATVASTTTQRPSPSPAPAAQGSSALTAEAAQTAAGDIPDNQVFLTFHDAGQGYTIKYPEGWARRGAGAQVTFQDKNNLVRIETATGARPTPAVVTAELTKLTQRTPSLSFAAPAAISVNGAKVIRVVYSTKSAPNPVTDKRVTLAVDRYYVPGPGKYAIVDLGTPRGVDNVDAYRLMIESFRWR